MLGKYKPSSLQGNFKRNKYFEGWFQKVYSTQHKSSFIIIYGYATRNSIDTFGFIQVLIPSKLPEIIYFSKNEVYCDPSQHIVCMGNNILTTHVIKIKTNDLLIDLYLKNNNPIKTFKNSMGYHYFIPYLPCYHSVLNSSHYVSGKIDYMQASYSLHNESGYLEKNWGTSFPENYFWLHAVDPNNSQVSLLFSQAEIKWLGNKFIRHIGHFRFDGKEIDLRNYNKINISNLIFSDSNYEFRIISRKIQMDISIITRNKVLFKGPENGSLTRNILHHTDAIININLKEDNKIRVFQLVGNFENIGSNKIYR